MKRIVITLVILMIISTMAISQSIVNQIGITSSDTYRVRNGPTDASDLFVVRGNTGNIGMGITSPLVRFHVYGAGVQRIRIQSSDNQAGIEVDGNSADGKWVIYNPQNSSALRFHVLSTANGNGTRMSILANGNVGIGTTTPVAKLHVSGDEGLLVQGTHGNGATQNLGSGTRMHFYSKKSAFRAGYVNGTQWDDVNIGEYSVAMGYRTTASETASTALGIGTIASGYYATAMGASTNATGNYSTTMGENTTASANYSIAMGLNNIASASNSTAMGYNTTASGYVSTTMGSNTTASNNFTTAMGYNTTASGYSSTAIGSSTMASGNYSTAMGSGTTAIGGFSTAFGYYTTARSTRSFVIGQYNLGLGSTDTWLGGDPVFEIGIGTSPVSKKNALTVLKNGRLGINTPYPSYLLDVAGTANLNKGISTGIALRVYGDEAIWYNNDYFSWGFGGNANYFADKVGIGTTTPSKMLYVNGSAGGTQAWNTSDVRYKKNISIVNDALDGILQLRGVEYEWLNQSDDESTGFDNKVHYGVIAQEVEEVFPYLIDNIGDTEQMKHVEYNGFVAIIIESIKEQQNTIKDLTKRIEYLESN